MIPMSYTVQNIRARPWTSAAVGAGCAIAAFSFSALLMTVQGIRQSMASATRDDVAIVLGYPGTDETLSALERSRIQAILTAPQIALDPQGRPVHTLENVRPVGLFRQGSAELGVVMARGMSADGFGFRPEVEIVSGRRFREGTTEAIVGDRIQGEFAGTNLGGRIPLSAAELVVVGTFRAGGSALESEIWCDRDVISRGPGDGIVLRVRLRSAAQLGEFQSFVNTGSATEVVASEREFVGRQSDRISRLIRVFGSVVILLLAAGAALGAAITSHGAVSRRRPEIGVLRAIGFSRAEVLGAFLGEASLLAALGGVPGALGSLALSRAELSMINATSSADFTFSLVATPASLVTAILASVLLGVTGAVLPAASAARLHPVEALRS